jgi:hypothetical protein
MKKIKPPVNIQSAKSLTAQADTPIAQK